MSGVYSVAQLTAPAHRRLQRLRRLRHPHLQQRHPQLRRQQLNLAVVRQAVAEQAGEGMQGTPARKVAQAERPRTVMIAEVGVPGWSDSVQPRVCKAVKIHRGALEQSTLRFVCSLVGVERMSARNGFGGREASTKFTSSASSRILRCTSSRSPSTVVAGRAAAIGAPGTGASERGRKDH